MPRDSLLLFFLLPPSLSIHTHTLFHFGTGQGRGRKEGLLRNVQDRVKYCFFMSVTGAKGTLSALWIIWLLPIWIEIKVIYPEKKKNQQFAFESCPSTNIRLEPYLYWSSGSPCTTIWWSDQDRYWVILPKAHMKLVNWNKHIDKTSSSRMNLSKIIDLGVYITQEWGKELIQK